MKRKKLKNENTVFIGMYVSKETAGKLADESEKRNLTISEIVRNILAEVLK